MHAERILDPELPEAPMHLVLPGDPVIGRVVKNESCMRGKSASYVHHIDIDVSGTPLEGQFYAGQSFGVIAPGEDERGRTHAVRLFSIASPSAGEDGEGKILSTTCKRFIDEYKPQTPKDDQNKRGLFVGVCSNYLCDLAPGAEVQISGPNGKRFLLPTEPSNHDFLFLATGTGIAPYRGMILELLKGPNGPVSSEIHLVMGAAYNTDLLYDDTFRALADEFPNFYYHTVVSREIQSDPSQGGYVHHYLDRQVQLHTGLLKNDRTLMYICGMAGMQLGVYQLLTRLGLDGPFLTIKDELADVDPADWELKQIKRYVRPTHRCMLEVY